MITLSNIGDAVLTTPVIELLRMLYPTASMDIVGDARSIDLFRELPCLRQCLLKDKAAMRRGSLELLCTLRRQRYDLVVDLRSPYLGHLLRSRRSLCVPWRQPRSGHAAERHVATLRPLFGELPAPSVRVHLNASQRAGALQRLEHLPRPRVAIAPGAKWPFKAWPVAHYQGLIQALGPAIGGVLLVGGEADRERTSALAAAATSVPLWDGAGQLSLLDTAAVLAEVDLFIGNDSGAGHMAAGVGTPTLTLFGPGEPQRYRPWSPKAHSLLAPEAKLELLPAEVVAEHAEAILAAPNSVGGLVQVGGRRRSS